MNQPELNFDAPAATHARDDAINRVAANVEWDWAAHALEAVWRTAIELESFIVDEVWSRIPECKGPHEPRAMGAVMRRARDNRWIEATDQYRASDRVTAHRNPRRVWRSLLFEGGA